jgi:hypothetical protein
MKLTVTDTDTYMDPLTNRCISWCGEHGTRVSIEVRAATNIAVIAGHALL